MCNIQIKHLKHLKYKLAIYVFSATSPYNLEEWRLVVAELDAGMEVDSGAWSSPVWQRCGQLTSGAASHEAPPPARERQRRQHLDKAVDGARRTTEGDGA
jgi:hypothetical protein